MLFDEYVVDFDISRMLKYDEQFTISNCITTLESLLINYERLREQAITERELKIIRLGRKKRQEMAGRHDLSEEDLFPTIRQLEEKYGVECIRDGYLPGKKPKMKHKTAISDRVQKILEELDDDSNNPYRFMPDLEHGYFYTAGSRITLFGDENRWAFVFEKSGYSNRGGSVDIELNYFGNCLVNLETAGMNGMFVCNTKNIHRLRRQIYARILKLFLQKWKQWRFAARQFRSLATQKFIKNTILT